MDNKKDIKKFNLDQLEKQNIFDTPNDQYFDELPQRIQKKILARKNSRKHYILSPKLKLAGFAACLVAVIVFLFTPDKVQTSLDVAQDDIIEYFEYEGISNDDFINESEVYELAYKEFDEKDLEQKLKKHITPIAIPEEKEETIPALRQPSSTPSLPRKQLEQIKIDEEEINDLELEYIDIDNFNILG